MDSLLDKVIQSLRQTGRHNSSIMVQPEAILWPDPERQWENVIPKLQAHMPELLIFGSYDASAKQGPAIWIKCMVARQLPEASWPAGSVPVIYIPGLSKQDLKNITAAGLDLQPLMEYQYTGVIFTQENGKEWTILAFLENQEKGMGVKVATDKATREAAVKAMPFMFEDPQVFLNKTFVDADFFLSLIFPEVVPTILKWLTESDSMFTSMAPGKRDSFINLCKSRFDFTPDYKNIKEIAEKLGSQRNAWAQVWQYFANAPRKYPKVQELLRLSKPVDLEEGLLGFPKESWPQVNEEMENELCQALMDLKKETISSIPDKLKQLSTIHSKRRNWIWSELEQAPLANALPYLITMAEYTQKPIPSYNMDDLVNYYRTQGYLADLNMRKALATTKTIKDTQSVVQVITLLYKPWLENLTLKFQSLFSENPNYNIPPSASVDNADFILFADAFRWELSMEFESLMKQSGYKTSLHPALSPLPTLTPTAKPACSPINDLVSLQSNCTDFRPQLINGQDLQTAVFRAALKDKDFYFAASHSEIQAGKNTWMEIGDIDSKGHEEQSAMVKHVDEFFEKIRETIDVAFEKGFKKIKIVTDHGWLLLPGGLPKKEFTKDLAETRWGRCALIKEGATTDLQYFPWHWNPAVHIAYAPGISFFRNNDEYAHGGISLHECLIPQMIIENSTKSEYIAKITSIKWTNLNCKIEIADAPDGYLIDIRSKYTDSSSSVVLSASAKKRIKDNKCTLIVSDECEGQAVWIVLMTPSEMIIDKQMTSVGL